MADEHLTPDAMARIMIDLLVGRGPPRDIGPTADAYRAVARREIDDARRKGLEVKVPSD